MASPADTIPVSGAAEFGIWRVILAASVGTMIWDKVGNMK